MCCVVTEVKNLDEWLTVVDLDLFSVSGVGFMFEVPAWLWPIFLHWIWGDLGCEYMGRSTLWTLWLTRILCLI